MFNALLRIAFVGEEIKATSTTKIALVMPLASRNYKLPIYGGIKKEKTVLSISTGEKKRWSRARIKQILNYIQQVETLLSRLTNTNDINDFIRICAVAGKMTSERSTKWEHRKNAFLRTYPLNYTMFKKYPELRHVICDIQNMLSNIHDTRERIQQATHYAMMTFEILRKARMNNQHLSTAFYTATEEKRQVRKIKYAMIKKVTKAKKFGTLQVANTEKKITAMMTAKIKAQQIKAIEVMKAKSVAYATVEKEVKACVLIKSIPYIAPRNL